MVDQMFALAPDYEQKLVKNISLDRYGEPADIAQAILSLRPGQLIRNRHGPTPRRYDGELISKLDSVAERVFRSRDTPGVRNYTKSKVWHLPKYRGNRHFDLTLS